MLLIAEHRQKFVICRNDGALSQRRNAYVLEIGSRRVNRDQGQAKLICRRIIDPRQRIKCVSYAITNSGEQIEYCVDTRNSTRERRLKHVTDSRADSLEYVLDSLPEPIPVRFLDQRFQRRPYSFHDPSKEPPPVCFLQERDQQIQQRLCRLAECFSEPRPVKSPEKGVKPLYDRAERLLQRFTDAFPVNVLE